MLFFLILLDFIRFKSSSLLVKLSALCDLILDSPTHPSISRFLCLESFDAEVPSVLSLASAKSRVLLVDFDPRVLVLEEYPGGFCLSLENLLFGSTETGLSWSDSRVALDGVRKDE